MRESWLCLLDKQPKQTCQGTATLSFCMEIVSIISGSHLHHFTLWKVKRQSTNLPLDLNKFSCSVCHAFGSFFFLFYSHPVSILHRNYAWTGLYDVLKCSFVFCTFYQHQHFIHFQWGRKPFFSLAKVFDCVHFLSTCLFFSRTTFWCFVYYMLNVHAGTNYSNPILNTFMWIDVNLFVRN